MSVPYSVESSASHYKNYYTNQAGGSIPVFRGRTIQFGSGIGAVFSKVFKGISPVLKQVAKSAGKQLLNTGMKIVDDTIKGKSLAKSAKSHFSEDGQMLLKKLSSKYVNPKVGGTKRKRRNTKNKFSKVSSKTKKRRLNSDIFN